MTQNHDQAAKPEPRPFTRDEHAAELAAITEAADVLFWRLSAAIDRTPGASAERDTLRRMFDLSGMMTSIAHAARFPNPPAAFAEPEPTVDELRERLARAEDCPQRYTYAVDAYSTELEK